MAYCCDNGLRTCSPWFDVRHCCCSLEQGAYSHCFSLLSRLFVSFCCADCLPFPHLLCVVILVILPGGTLKTLGRNMRLNHKNIASYIAVVPCSHELAKPQSTCGDQNLARNHV